MRYWRVLGVTILLAALAGFAGALGGSLLGMLLMLLRGQPPNQSFYLSVLGIAGIIGAGVGVVAGPILTWLFLRHVPIWRAITETGAGAGVGVALSMPFLKDPDMMLVTAVAGALLAALRLRRVFLKPRARTSA